ncbi:MAG: peptidylprolyl isomerase [Cellulosilyticaceae bacterium]
MNIKDYGTVTLELYPEKAPNTVNNFVALADSGFYDGLTFHRIIEGFMIQGGDPDGTGAGGPGYSIPGEFSSNGYTANDLSHAKGVISMARAQNPDSAGSQFFIMSADNTPLDGNYAAFGQVTEGLDVIEKLEKVETVDKGRTDKPAEPVVIESVTVDTHGEPLPEVYKVDK